ncbi:antibiotic biosynthesis monooxygenase family protein [Fodinibius halophilus]|uniref:ABM domain-containing protein n=1 Tax=Fodinibius halophilus TaxID=1736908 RepID=A0A6M1T3A3_9BACT|nr:antibiotic biosynthesis monooxygenase [Fodinibius halophilus]NGP89916.1 hypothetical protein [Fodinibius halophilus]
MESNAVVVIVEHFLNRDGREYFDDWIEEVRNVLDSYEGFRSLQRIFDPQQNDRTLLYLTFEELDQLREWSSSDDHEAMLDLIIPYQQQKQESQIYTTENDE